MKKQKLLSLACAAALIATVFSAGAVKTKAEDSTGTSIADFGKTDSYVDFSEYKARLADGVTQTGNDNNAGGNVDIITVDENNTDLAGATGTKVAKIYQDGTDKTNYKRTYFRVTETGAANTETRLNAGETYRIKLRYKLNTLQFATSGKGLNIGLVVGISGNVNTLCMKDSTISGTAYKQNAQIYYADSNGNPTSSGIDATRLTMPSGINTWDNPCKLWTDASEKDVNGWVTASLDFTMPEYKTSNDGTAFSQKDTIIGFANTLDGLNPGLKFEMYIDWVSITHISPVTIVEGENSTTSYIVPGTSMAELGKSEEKYDATDSAKAEVVETKYYEDAECTKPVDVKNGVYGIDTTLYKKSDVTVVDTENQAIFCGFDSYKLRTKPDDVTINFNSKNMFFYSGNNAKGYATQSFDITSEDSYTGSSSLKYNYKNGEALNDDFRKAVYIGNGKDLTIGKTYELSFWYKPIENLNESDTVTFKFKSGVGYFGGCETVTSGDCKVEGLSTQKDWKQAKLVWTCEVDSVTANSLTYVDGKENYVAPMLRIATGADRTALYIDTMVISEVTSNEGASMLKSDNLDDGKQAIRFLFSYDTVLGKGNTVKLGSGEYTVKERGILVKSAANDTSKLERGTEDARVIKTVKTNEFDTCWQYDDATGKYQFSMYIKGLETDDTRELVSRGYVVLTDGENEFTFYSEENTTSLEKIAAGQPTA